MALGHTLDELIERRVAILFYQGSDDLKPACVEARSLPPATRFGLDRSGLSVAPQEIDNEGSADTEPLGQAALGAFAALIRFENLRP